MDDSLKMLGVLISGVIVWSVLKAGLKYETFSTTRYETYSTTNPVKNITQTYSTR